VISKFCNSTHIIARGACENAGYAFLFVIAATGGKILHATGRFSRVTFLRKIGSQSHYELNQYHC
jgi:hypothetical protein